jgi:hypothetical protein
MKKMHTRTKRKFRLRDLTSGTKALREIRRKATSRLQRSVKETKEAKEAR